MDSLIFIFGDGTLKRVYRDIAHCKK